VVLNKLNAGVPFMSKLSLKRKLIAIFGFLIILFTMFCAYSIYSANRFAIITNTIYEHPLNVSNAALEAANGILRIHKAMDELYYVKDKQQVAEILKSINREERSVSFQFNIIETKILGKEGKELISEALDQFHSWRKVTGEMADIIEKGVALEILDSVEEKHALILSGLEEKLLEIQQYARDKADTFMSDATDYKAKTYSFSLLYAFIVIISCFSAAVLFARGLLKQLGADPHKLADIALRISNQDIDIDFNDEDKSGVYKAMGEMVQALKLARDNEINRRWFRQGLVDLDNSIRGEFDIKKMTESIISHTTTYTSSLIGALYLSDSNGNLEYYAGHAIGPKHKKKILYGEGLAGAVAKSGNSITYSDIPKDYLNISSSLGDALPKEIFIVPIKYNNQVIGVMELAKDRAFTIIERELIERIAENIGVSINMAKAQSKVNELLVQTQKQAEELQQQQEELRVSNEELEEQTKMLQISEKKLQQQQEELRVTNEELEERSSAIENQRDEMKRQNEIIKKAQAEVVLKAKALEEASRYKSEFLANMSHELRTPLNSILILSQLLSEDKFKNLNEKQIEYSKTIYMSGNNLLKLINDILDLSKIEAGRFEISIESIDVKELVKEIETEVAPIAANKNITFDVEIDKWVPDHINTDMMKVSQVLKNLLSNAVKFTEKGGVVLGVKLNENDETINNVDYKKGELLHLSVKDTGVGIPQDKIEHIFEAFRQVDGTTSRKYGGTGLGLTISKKLCSMLGGEIRIDSKIDEGATFSVLLPITNAVGSVMEYMTPQVEDISSENVSAVDSIPKSKKTFEKDENLLDKEVLLIIEDDPNFVTILKEIAEGRGFAAVTASDGEEGLYLADYYKPKAILLDISLPGIDGFEVMRRLKENSETKSIPVHFISATDMTMKAMHMGAVGFLTKPVTTAGLEDAFLKIEEIINKTVKNLLVVEDNDIQRNSIVELIGNGDVVTTAVATGEEAYNLLMTKDFDCMILDLGLEDMDGLQFLNRITNNKDIKEIPVIVYTGKDLTQSEEKVLHQYAGSIIIKGARSPERLLAETSLFLHRIEKNLPDEKKKMLNITSGESVLLDKTILIVDDDMRNVFALSSVLEENGMKVVMAQNGKEGVEKALGDEKIDLILMDIMMPVMDGYEATREIRKDKRGEKLPIIALTAKAMASDRTKCIEAGANEYMAKPVNIDKLLSLLRVWLYK